MFLAAEEDLIERCETLLETRGREPKEWPVPIKRDDLEKLLDVYCAVEMLLKD